MTANVDTMMARKVQAWHGLANVVDADLDPLQALEPAGIGWRVDLRPLYWNPSPSTPAGGGDVPMVCASDGRRQVVRLDTLAGLGTVGADYHALQNVDLARAVMDAAASRGVVVESAGALDGGRVVFLLAILGTFEPQPGDKLARYLCVSNAHDGSQGVHAMMTTVRVVCSNTLAQAGREARASGRFQSVVHRASVESVTRDTVAAIASGRAMLERVNGRDAALTVRPMSSTEALDYYAAVYARLRPLAESAKPEARASWERARTAQAAAWERARQEEQRIAREHGWDPDTAWTALQGLTRWSTHDRRVRKGREAQRGVESMLGIGSGAKASAIGAALLED